MKPDSTGEEEIVSGIRMKTGRNQKKDASMIPDAIQTHFSWFCLPDLSAVSVNAGMSQVNRPDGDASGRLIRHDRETNLRSACPPTIAVLHVSPLSGGDSGSPDFECLQFSSPAKKATFPPPFYTCSEPEHTGDDTLQDRSRERETSGFQNEEPYHALSESFYYRETAVLKYRIITGADQVRTGSGICFQRTMNGYPDYRFCHDISHDHIIPDDESGTADMILFSTTSRPGFQDTSCTHPRLDGERTAGLFSPDPLLVSAGWNTETIKGSQNEYLPV